MTLLRLALFCVLLMLLALLGAGIYAYQNFPAIVQAQARQYLADFGVEEITYENLKVGREQLRAGSLRFSGEYNGLAYDATVLSLALQYDWRMLLIGEVESVTMNQLTIAVREPATIANPASSTTVVVSNLLPEPWLTALPAKRVDIEHWQLNYRAGDQPPVSAQGSFKLNEQLAVTLKSSHRESHLSAQILTEGEHALPRMDINLHDGNRPIGNLLVKIAPTQSGNWQWSVQGEFDYSALLSWFRRLGPDLSPPLDLTALDGLELAGGTTFSALVEHPEEIVIAETEPDAFISQFTVHARTKNHISRLDYPAIVTELTSTFDLNLDFEQGQAHITLGPTDLTARLLTQQLSLSRETLDWLRWKEAVDLHWRNPEAITLTPSLEKPWSFALGDNLLVVGNKYSELRSEQLQLSASLIPGGTYQLEGELSARLDVRLQKQQLPQLKMTVSHSGSAQKSEFSLTLNDTAESMSFAVQGNANLATGQGNYRVSASSQDLSYASSTVLPVLQSFDLLSERESPEISSGKLKLETQVSSRGFDLDQLTQHSLLEITDLAGLYEEYLFDGLALSAQWSGVDRWQTTQPIELFMESLDLGFKLTNTAIALSLPEATPIARPLVKLESFSAGIFGGEVVLPRPQPWDFAADTNHFTLRAEGWQLAAMVALQQGQDIQAHGILEGELPATVSGGRIMITDGYLRALAPGGSIRYIANEASEALAQSSPELALALDLLSDFQYQVLSSEVNLDEAGNLLLGLSLAGKNPAQYEGRPINFNINLEQNLDPLLQSLRLSDKLVEKLEGRIH